MPAVTWLDVVKTQLGANPGKSVKDVVPAARKEWNLIKSGKHPTKTQGKMVFKRKKGKSKKGKKRSYKGKTRKHHRRSKGKTCKQKYVACKKARKSRKSRKSKRPASGWIAHIKSVQKNKGISYKEAMKIAAKTYKK